MMDNHSPTRQSIDCGENTNRNDPSLDMPEIAINFDGFDLDHTTLSHLPDFENDIGKLRDDSSNKVHTNDTEKNPNIFREKIPENATNVDDVDATIAKQMMALSVEDREKVYMDVHGVKEGPRENSEDIQAALVAMQMEIEKLEDKEAYDQARSMDQNYVEDRSFRLAFLRSVYYDPKKAAIKVVRYFQLKLDLFGEEKLTLDIVQDDLDRETMDALYTGRGQCLDATDRTGRYILMIFSGDIFSAKAMVSEADVGCTLDHFP